MYELAEGYQHMPFSNQGRLPGSVPFACPCKHDVKHIHIPLQTPESSAALSLRLSRVHLDLCAALLSIICQVSLFSFNISTNCRVKTQITLDVLVVLFKSACYFKIIMFKMERFISKYGKSGNNFFKVFFVNWLDKVKFCLLSYGTLLNKI